MLLNGLIQVEVRSAGMLRGEDLLGLKKMLEESPVVKQYREDNRPERGSIVFDCVPMTLLELLRQARRQRYEEFLEHLTPEDAFSVGLPIVDGAVRIPAVSTLNTFVNHVLNAELGPMLSEEFAAFFVSKGTGQSVATMDSSPVEASKNNRSAEYNPHYKQHMFKAHISMLDGVPLTMTFTDGNVHDNTQAEDLMKRSGKAGLGPRHCGCMQGDAAYSPFLTYANCNQILDVPMIAGKASNHVFHKGVDEEMIDRAVNRLWKEGGNPKAPLRTKLRFLFKKGMEKMVGVFLRNRRMGDPGADELYKNRGDCEKMHAYMDRWVGFDAIGLHRKHREQQVRGKFLCVQMLCVLFGA